ncbi:hypothetical protein [Lactiplantibacillus plantarum]|uniref:hypothetical protein n=1 Tax=Lactiplantibacillus plantarum TaxID=1590 RepID=UPI001EDC5EF7|nr:hypothetical protein [Lactiplantibacillus plantarum]
MTQFETERLILRPMTAADHDALADMLFDSQVVAYLRTDGFRVRPRSSNCLRRTFWQTRPLFLALNVAVIIN